MLTVSHLFAASRAAIHLDGHDKSVAAAGLVADGQRVAGALAARGLGPGDRVAVWASNGLPYLRCLLAAAAGRLVLVSVNSRFGDDEAWSIIERSGARALITDHAIDRDRPELDPIGLIDTDEIAAMVDHPPVAAEPDPDDPFLVFTTSGTTSQPKLVLHTQRSTVAHAHDVARAIAYDETTKVMIALPLCGVFGLTGLTGAVAGGSRIWLPERFDAEWAAATIEREGVTTMNGPDDMYHRLMATDRDLSSIDVGGYAIFNSSLHDLVERAERRGVTVTGLYGMSEVQALFAMQNPRLPTERRKLGGGEVVSPEAAARVVDPDTGRVLGVGVDGELQLLGPSLFGGYLAEGGTTIDPELTGAAHVTDADDRRWFRTGDLARMEADGSFTYISRIGDVLRLGGFLVAPGQIEDVLLQRPEIAEAQVVTVARPDGVRPVAIVIAVASIDEEAVKEHCRQQLPLFKVPIRVLEVDEFPVTRSANGIKIQRNKLQRLAADGVEDGSGGSTRSGHAGAA